MKKYIGKAMEHSLTQRKLYKHYRCIPYFSFLMINVLQMLNRNDSFIVMHFVGTNLRIDKMIRMTKDGSYTDIHFLVQMDDTLKKW